MGMNEAIEKARRSGIRVEQERDGAMVTTVFTRRLSVPMRDKKGRIQDEVGYRLTSSVEPDWPRLLGWVERIFAMAVLDMELTDQPVTESPRPIYDAGAIAGDE